MIRNLFTAILLLGVLTTYAQKIPFQGKLTENDERFTGAVDLQFSIPSIGWVETHSSVGVLDGFYSVVLGSITPLPDSLFDNSDEVSMIISVNESPLTPITLYAPYGTNSGRFVINETTDTTTSALQVYNNSTGTSFGVGSRTGAYIEARGEGLNTGLFAYSENGRSINNQTELTDPNVYVSGQLASLYGTSSVGGRAIQAQYTATGPGAGVGLSGYSGGEGQNWGVWGRANSVAGQDSTQVGVHGEGFGSGAGDHYGVQGRAYAPNASRNIGVYGSAYDGINENWAGYFDGDVNITGRLVGGGGLSLDSIVTSDVRLENESAALRAHLNIFNDAGSLVLNGPNDSTNVILGGWDAGYGGILSMYDSLRNVGARLTTTRNGVGNLLLYDQTHNNSAWIGTLQGGGIMQITAYDSTGQNTGALYAYHPNGLPTMILESNNGGAGPFAPLVHLNTFDDNGNHKGEINVSSLQRTLNGHSSGITMSMSPQDQPFIELKSGNDLNWDVRGQFRVDSVNSLGTAGRLELLGPIGNTNGDPIGIFSVSAINDESGADPNGVAGELFLWGDESPNIQIGGAGWEDHDLGYMNFYGSVPDNGGGWYYNALSMGASSDGSGRENGYLNMYANQPGDSSSVETVMINGSMFGSGAGGMELKDAAGNPVISLDGSNGSALFDGDVTINGQLFYSGGIPTDTIITDQVGLDGGGSLYKAKLSTVNSAGELELRGANDSLSVVMGSSGATGAYQGSILLYDSLGASKTQIMARNNGGYIQIDQKDGSGSFQSAVTMSATNSNSNMRMFGQNSNLDNVQYMIENYITPNQINNGPQMSGNYRRSGTDWLDNQGRLLAAIGNSRDETGSDPTGTSGFLSLWGTNSFNATISGNRLNNNDYPELKLFGRTRDGGGFFLPNVEMDVRTDEIEKEWGELRLFSSDTTLQTRVETIALTSDHVNTGAGALLIRDASGTTTITLDGNTGDVDVANLNYTGILNGPSDRRLKSNINNIPEALAKVSNLNGVTFNWNKVAEEKMGITDKSEQIGVIAQELEEVFPQLVTTNDKGVKTVNYLPLTAILIEAIKELDQKVSDLKAENADLKASLDKKKGQQSDDLAALKAEIEAIKKILGTSAQGAGK